MSERKRATILFADIAGSTRLGETLDVERLHEVMTSFFDAMREEVEALGGIIDSFVGDAVLAVFGVPLAHGDDADRAVTAARRMIGRLSELNYSTFSIEGAAVEMRVGINSGEVVIASDGDTEIGRLTGDAVNVAARLHEHADPGSVLVTERTMAMATAFNFKDRGLVELRGRSESVRIFELLTPADPGERSSMRVAPFVGRTHELSVLESLYARTVQEQTPHLATIYGSAGVGKSRLIAEVIESLRHRQHSPRILMGRCRPYGEVVAYGPLADIIRTSASIIDGDSSAEALAKIGNLIATFDSSTEPGHLPQAIDALAYTAGIATESSSLPEMPPHQIRAEIRNAWRWFFTASAGASGTVVLVEDIHWADPALLDLLENLEERVEGAVLFLCPARPSLSDTRPSWGGGRRSFSSLSLDPLNLEESADLIGSLTATEGLPEQVMSRILDRAEGNPFFLEEIIRSLLDTGTAVLDLDGVRAVSKVADIQIPDTVHAAVAARIDLLDADQKRALQCAAVVGRTFWLESLTFILEWEGEKLQAVLDALERRDLVDSWLDGDTGSNREYRFRHALTRDVAYDTLSRRDRTAIHRWVAEWLARRSAHSSQAVGLRAHHLLKAYVGLAEQRQDGAEAAQTRLEAFDALIQASGQAKRRVALGEAKYFARQAIGIAVDDVERAAASEAIGEAFFFGNEGDGAWTHLREAVDLRLQTHNPDPHDVARICARALEMPVRYPGAMLSPPDEATVSQYLEIGMAHVLSPDSEDAIRLHTLKAFWQHAFSRGADDQNPPLVSPAEAIRSAELAADAAHRIGRADLESAALDGLGACHLPEGNYRAALEAAERRLGLVEKQRDIWEVGDTFAMNAWLRYHIGHYGLSRDHAAEGFDRTVGVAPSLALHCLRWKAQAAFRLGEWDSVLESYRLSRRLLEDKADMPPHYVSPMYAVAALVHEIRGEGGDADMILELLKRSFDATALADRDTSPFGRWAEFLAPLLARRGRIDDAREIVETTAWRRKGRLGLLLEADLEVAEYSGDPLAAKQVVGDARALATTRGLEALAAATTATEGRLAQEAGDQNTAINLLEQAVSDFAGLGANWDRARAGVLLGRSFIAVGRDEEGTSTLAEALATLDGLGARREVDSVREAIRAGQM